MQPEPPSQPAAPQPPPTGRQWPAAFAIVTAWVRPATTTARTTRVSLFRAFAVHVVGLLLLVVAFVYLEASSPWAQQDGSTLARMMAAFDQFLDSLVTFPVQTLLAMTWGFVGAELFTLTVVLAALPFGARDERIRDTIGHALRRCWLHTSHVALVVLVGGAIENAAHGTRLEWRQKAEAAFQESIAPDSPLASVDPSASSPLAREYWRAQNEFIEAYPTPWYVRNSEFIPFISGVSAFLWVVWSLFRGIAAPRSTAQKEPSPPLCRWCGYNLTGAPIDGRCSECGRPIISSLAEDADPGAPWERRHEIGWLRAYGRTVWAGLVHVRDLARKLKLAPPAPACLRFLVLHLLACQVVAMAGWMAYFEWESSSWMDRTDRFFASLGLGSVVTILIFCYISLVTTLIGVIERIQHGRNILGGLSQSACYASGYMVAWTVVTTATLLAGHIGLEDFEMAGDAIGIDGYLVAGAVWISLIVLGAVGFALRLVHAPSALRYARR